MRIPPSSPAWAGSILGIAAIALIASAGVGAQEHDGAAAPDRTLTAATGKSEAAPESLEQAIATALRDNPDVRLAEAKVRAATADLNRVRLDVVREITTAYAEARWQRQAKEVASELLHIARAQFQSGAAGADSAIAAQEAVDRAATALVKAEAKLPYLLGSSVRVLEASRTVPAGSPPPSAPDRELSARVQELLDRLESQEADLRFEETSLADALESISSIAGVSFVVSYSVDAEDNPVTLEMSAPLRHCLIAIADQNDELCFVVRDYGILVTTVEHARRLGGPTIPSDVTGGPQAGY